MPQQQEHKTEWKAAFVKWVGLFPALLVIAYTTKWIGIQPLALKLFVETIIVVPLVHYLIGPWMKDLFHDWVYDEPDQQGASTS